MMVVKPLNALMVEVYIGLAGGWADPVTRHA